MQPFNSWEEVLGHLFQRYLVLANTHRKTLEERLGKKVISRTIGLCEHAFKHLPECTIAEDKANRWLGFAQGILIAGEVLDIDEERDYTRPLFHAVKGPSPSIDVRLD